MSDSLAKLRDDVEVLTDTVGHLFEANKIFFDMLQERDQQITILQERIGSLERGRATQGTEILRLQIKMDALENE